MKERCVFLFLHFPLHYLYNLLCMTLKINYAQNLFRGKEIICHFFPSEKDIRLRQENINTAHGSKTSRNILYNLIGLPVFIQAIKCRLSRSAENNCDVKIL